jgi:response regulator NasT
MFCGRWRLLDKIIVAFENDNNRRRVCELLESGGMIVGGSFRSGADVIRAVGRISGCIVVCGYKFPDMTAVDLAHNVGNRAMVLVIASQQLLNMIEDERIFKLATPFSRSDLLSSVKILMQMEGKVFKGPPRRTGKEAAEIARAKELLMMRNGMTENEAHRFIQRRSMDTGRKAVETARLIIQSYEAIE